jgi:hypothetical protein
MHHLPASNPDVALGERKTWVLASHADLLPSLQLDIFCDSIIISSGDLWCVWYIIRCAALECVPFLGGCSKVLKSSALRRCDNPGPAARACASSFLQRQIFCYLPDLFPPAPSSSLVESHMVRMYVCSSVGSFVKGIRHL